MIKYFMIMWLSPFSAHKHANLDQQQQSRQHTHHLDYEVSLLLLEHLKLILLLQRFELIFFLFNEGLQISIWAFVWLLTRTS